MWGLLMLGAAIAYDPWESDKKKMRHWSIEKLHAYAGIRSNPKALKTWAYDLAKQKKFDSM